MHVWIICPTKFYHNYILSHKNTRRRTDDETLALGFRKRKINPTSICLSCLQYWYDNCIWYTLELDRGVFYFRNDWQATIQSIAVNGTFLLFKNQNVLQLLITLWKQKAITFVIMFNQARSFGCPIWSGYLTYAAITGAYYKWKSSSCLFYSF